VHHVDLVVCGDVRRALKIFRAIGAISRPFAFLSLDRLKRSRLEGNAALLLEIDRLKRSILPAAL
jgi:hypothetical protein